MSNVANISAVVLPSAQQTALLVNSQTMINTDWKGAHITFNVSGYTSGQYTPHIQGYDPGSGNWYDILIGTGNNILNSAGEVILKVYPGIQYLAGGAANDILPANWRVQLVGASSPNMVLSVGVNMIF